MGIWWFNSPISFTDSIGPTLVVLYIHNSILANISRGNITTTLRQYLHQTVIVSRFHFNCYCLALMYLMQDLPFSKNISRSHSFHLKVKFKIYTIWYINYYFAMLSCFPEFHHILRKDEVNPFFSMLLKLQMAIRELLWKSYKTTLNLYDVLETDWLKKELTLTQNLQWGHARCIIYNLWSPQWNVLNLWDIGLCFD